MRHIHLALAIVVLGALVGLAPSGATAAAKAPESPLGPGTDVVFLVDASGSVQSTDPDASRRTVLRAIIDLALRRGGDRVAVYRFAGRHETAERAVEAETLHLTEVPKDARRGEVLARLHEAAGKAAEIFPGALATDFNAAFEVGLEQILRERGPGERPLWVILVSDGDSEVERGSDAHPDYVAEAERRYGKTLTRYLNKAATDLLREKVLPSFEGPGRFFTAINVAAPEVADGDALAAVAARGSGGDVLRVTDRPLRDLILPALGTAPGALGRAVARGIAYEAFTVEGAAERTFRTCGRLGRTGVLVYADSAEFEVALAKPNGEPLTEGSIEISGQGERYRVITVAGLPSGEYRLTVKSPKPLRAERIVYHEMDVEVQAELLEARAPFRPGEAVDLDVRLLDRASGRVIVDADVLEDVTAAVRVETPAGPVDVGEVALGGAASGTARLNWSIPPGAERGAWLVDVQALGLKDPGGEPGLRSESRGAARFDVVPALAVSWEVGEIDVSGAVGLRGRPPAGSLPVGATIPVRLVQGSREGNRTETLRWSAESAAYVATVEGLAAGSWRVTSPPDARIEILAGSVGTLRVVSPTASVPFPWLLAALGALLLLLALAVLGILRSMRRRALVVEQPADETVSVAAEEPPADADAMDMDEELLLDDEGLEEVLASLPDDEPMLRRNAVEEEAEEPETEDLETLILDE